MNANWPVSSVTAVCADVPESATVTPDKPMFSTVTDPDSEWWGDPPVRVRREPGGLRTAAASGLSFHMRYFNKEGPIVRSRHYCIEPLSRLDVDDVLGMIADQRYFVLHAPRQTGKTTVLGALRDRLNDSGEYRCVYINVEPGAAAREDVRAVAITLLDRLAYEASVRLGDDGMHDIRSKALKTTGPYTTLQAALGLWAAADRKPLVLLIDEIDALIGDSLLSVLRQLRAGYWDRPDFFPQSVVLCGVRDVRDYRIEASSEPEPVTGGSAFNIKAASLRLGNFSDAEVDALLGQHTEETGQRFADDAVAEIMRLTRGQPWLVNAVAHEACFAKEGLQDRTLEVGEADVGKAAERLILRRDTHLDQLLEKLKEERVQRVIEPLLNGVASRWRFDPEDLKYTRDLGLVSPRRLAVANPIYREVIPRSLSAAAQDDLEHEPELVGDPTWYVGSDGRLQVSELMAAFQRFFRENSEHWLDRFQYKEAGPQLLLQAFLQRVVNSGGRIEREYGAGRRRMDLGILWPAPTEEQRAVIECKLVRSGRERAIRLGVEQTAAYMDVWGAEEGHLAVFDRRADASWRERVFRRDEAFGGHAITVWGM